MSRPRCAPDSPVAILTFHSHSDRSFLDDRELALLSGVLRSQGIANDLVLTVVAPTSAGLEDESILSLLADRLTAYDPIVFERVWSPDIIRRLRDKLPTKRFIGLRGEHELLESSPADFFCDQRAAKVLGPLIRWLRGDVALPPDGVLVRTDADVPWQEGVWERPRATCQVEEIHSPYAPNLRPLLVNPELLPSTRTFSIQGNEGCPFQLDARDNPLYAGANLPPGLGRGCAFCTTGNHYEGRPNPETTAFVLQQLRYVRENAPELELLVLKDQNPFGYLTEVVEACQEEGLGGFSLLLETRAEWFLRNAARFDRALQVAGKIGIRIAPFLVGIESFSQAELDRFNKGTTAATNLEFLRVLWTWKDRYGDALDLSHAAFGFILFSPWTSMQDLETNLRGIRESKLDQLRGSLLLSRARLYPDTALYYLAKRDGLLVSEFESEASDASRRYGYYPSRPWKHAHADVAHFAQLATQLCERNRSRDTVNLFDALLAEFRAAGADWHEITAEGAWRRYQSMRPHASNEPRDETMPLAPPALRQRLARLLRPLDLAAEIIAGWRFSEVRARPGHIQLHLRHAEEGSLRIDIVPRSEAPCFRRSHHYDIRAAAHALSTRQEEALRVVANAILSNDS